MLQNYEYILYRPGQLIIFINMKKEKEIKWKDLIQNAFPWQRNNSTYLQQIKYPRMSTINHSMGVTRKMAIGHLRTVSLSVNMHLYVSEISDLKTTMFAEKKRTLFCRKVAMQISYCGQSVLELQCPNGTECPFSWRIGDICSISLYQIYSRLSESPSMHFQSRRNVIGT